MISKYKNNFFGYFKFIYSIVGKKLIISSFLSIAVGVLDGIGLAMFIPLLQSVDSGSEQSTKHSMGYLHYITDAIQWMGFSLTLESVLLSLIILFVLKGITKFAELNYQAAVMQFFMKKVRLQLVRGLQNITYKGFTHLDAGTIQNTFIAEVQRMSQGVRHFLAYSQALFMLMTYISFAVLANYQFAFLLAISAGLTNLVFSRVYKKMKKISSDISKKGNNFNSYMIQAVRYFKYLKSTNYLSIYSQNLKKVIDRTEYLNRKTAFYNAVTVSVREPMILVIVVVVIIIQLNLMGGNLSSIILSLLLFYRALNYLVVLQQSWQNFLQNTGALRSVASLSEKMMTLGEMQGKKTFVSLDEDIDIENADISYGKNKVLNGINIHIPKKQTIALVGESGSGKTTLANLIMGLIIPDKGTMRIDNISLSEYNLDSYRSKIGYISQDPVIFNDSIFNNVTFWSEMNPEILSRFWQVIEMASLKDFVENQADKEFTVLGDNGILVSGGQKQRISIAREMFKNAEILILDEATSALDSETELLIQENIEKLHGHYTMIVIAHRLSTIKNVDKIYLLEQGQVVKSGDFESMILNSEKFKRMVFLQGL